MSKVKQYNPEFQLHPVKSAQQIGSAKAARELGIQSNTLYGWTRAHKEGRLNGVPRTLSDAMTLTEEVTVLRSK